MILLASAGFDEPVARAAPQRSVDGLAEAMNTQPPNLHETERTGCLSAGEIDQQPKHRDRQKHILALILTRKCRLRRSPVNSILKITRAGDFMVDDPWRSESLYRIGGEFLQLSQEIFFLARARALA